MNETKTADEMLKDFLEEAEKKRSFSPDMQQLLTYAAQAATISNRLERLKMALDILQEEQMQVVSGDKIDVLQQEQSAALAGFRQHENSVAELNFEQLRRLTIALQEKTIRRVFTEHASDSCKEIIFRKIHEEFCEQVSRSSYDDRAIFIQLSADLHVPASIYLEIKGGLSDSVERFAPIVHRCTVFFKDFQDSIEWLDEIKDMVFDEKRALNYGRAFVRNFNLADMANKEEYERVSAEVAQILKAM